MKLVSFSARRYRSISKAEKIPLGNLTVLVGPNNEGKSNILKALDLALGLVARGSRSLRHRSRIPLVLIRNYKWERDFPVELRTTPRGSKSSSFTLEFLLDEQDIRDFQDEVGSHLNGILLLQIQIGQSGAELKISKQGRGSAALNQKIDRVLAFIRERLAYDYIPAIRTADSSTRVVERILSAELSEIEGDPRYQEALRTISQLQEPILRRVSQSIQDTLSGFLPRVTSARVVVEEEDRQLALRQVQVLVNDGSETNLRQKGDGVQSLAAIAMMRHSSQRRAMGRHVVLAIEEPESHLHPSAIAQVRRVLTELSATSQVVITTHSPELVDRGSIRSNVLVSEGNARSARTLSEIRDALGVRLSHSLQHSDLMLLVEGETDKAILQHILSHLSARLRKAIADGMLAISPLHGVTNLPHMATLLGSALIPLHCFLDADAAAREAFERARERAVLEDRDVHYTICRGQRESELEDLIDTAVYQRQIEQEFGITLDCPQFRSAEKWSVRLRNSFRRQGRDWNDEVCVRAQEIVSNAVLGNAATALHEERCDPVEALANALSDRLSELRL